MNRLTDKQETFKAAERMLSDITAALEQAMMEDVKEHAVEMAMDVMAAKPPAWSRETKKLMKLMQQMADVVHGMDELNYR